jgi:colicin import membrane protein
MRLRTNPGLTVSALAHAALLLAILLGFSQARRVEDPHEAVPVEVIDGRELGQVMKGEKAAASIKASPRVEKRADVTEAKPLPPQAEAKKDVAAPPALGKPLPEPGQDTKKADPAKAEPKAAQKTAAVQPPARSVAPQRPDPKEAAKPRPAKQAEAPASHDTAKSVPAEDAEPIAPKPKVVPKPAPKPKVVQKPEPPKDPKPPVVTKKPAPRFEPDRLAELLEQEDQAEALKKAPAKPVAKPRSGDPTAQPERHFDPTDISKFLSKEAPQRKASAGPELQRLAALGALTASAAKMSPSLWDQLDGLLQEQYKRCWTFIGLGGQTKYVPEIRVQFAADGSLTQPPELLNPPSDANSNALADSALRAVRRCDPLHIPARFQAYYEQWKGRVVRFDPEEMQ